MVEFKPFGGNEVEYEQIHQTVGDVSGGRYDIPDSFDRLRVEQTHPEEDQRAQIRTGDWTDQQHDNVILVGFRGVSETIYNKGLSSSGREPGLYLRLTGNRSSSNVTTVTFYRIKNR